LTAPTRRRSSPCLAAAVIAGAIAAAPDAAPAAEGERLHGITRYGEAPLYPPDFEHWDYVNPDAPKGGDLVLSAFGTFDSLNSYITRGTPAAALTLIYDSLLSSNADEGLLAYYADLAESFEIADDGSWLVVHMRPDARFHDGHPITAEDVVFTHRTLREHGAPRFRDRFYDDLAPVEAIDDHTVRFESSNPENALVALQVATFPVFPAHWWEGRSFEETSLEPPLGSGPYRIAEVDPGRSIGYERVEDYWARDLPQNVGQHNLDTITYEYYRDPSVMTEAFIGGEVDFMGTIESQDWTTRFGDAAPVEDGLIVMEQIESDEPESWLGLLMNLRRPVFRDPALREAMLYFYDFETARRTVHYGLFERTDTYFPNTEMAHDGLPEGRELEILERFRDRMPDRVRERLFTEPFEVPETDGSGNIRGNLRTAMGLLREAGYEVRDGVMTDVETGEPLAFEIMYRSPNLERVLNPLVANFRRAGIEVTLRLVDTSQYVRRLDEFDFDMILIGLVQFYPPTSALRGLWGSAQADVVGAENFTGIQDPVLDELIELVVQADDLDEITAAANALDRYVSWQFVSIPFYHDPTYRIAYWDMLDRPETKPRFSLGFPSSWWFDPSNPDALMDNR